MFGETLRHLIKKKYRSLNVFSEACDISSGHLTDMLSGRSLPKLSKLKILEKNLEPLTVEDRKSLLREWAFDKSEGILRDDFEEIESKNKNMLQVLESLESEKLLLEKLNDLKPYETLYNAFFKELSSDETKVILTAMMKELKLIALEKGNTEECKEKFKELEEIINKI